MMRPCAMIAVRNQSRHLRQRYVHRQWHGAEVVGRQHHDRLGLMPRRLGKVGEVIRMALEAEARLIKRFLLDRSGDHAGA